MTEGKDEMEWHRDHSEVLALADHLIDEGELVTASDALEYFQKPWHWEPERDEWKAREGEGDAAREGGSAREGGPTVGKEVQNG